MKIGRAFQLLVRWPEISAAVPEGSEDLERERREVEATVADASALHDRFLRQERAVLRRLRALLDEHPDCHWPAISGPGVQRRCTLELLTRPGPCVECVDSVESGTGGWIGDPAPGPLCGRCLAQASPELAAMLGLLSYLRQISDADLEDDPQAENELMESLLILTRVWAQSCAGAWPSRPQGMRAAREQGLEMIRQHLEMAGAGQPPEDGEDP